MVEIYENVLKKRINTFAKPVHNSSVYSGIYNSRASEVNKQVETYSYIPKEVNYKEEGEVKTVTNNELEMVKKYKELLDMGAITQEEFDRKKKELLKL